ncbi:lipase [Melampsora larici-populina 98AG31]|uniref:Lipase n=1 Tax=Melampsora larici-populina (strain 98AG31 / pathotype 3-4-7) TaxID=747676 RepID=F4S8B3_MELLP|nr:lipase [Melampsora larici-populina 98AG31]EGF99065.1 lipase [Melampsora larici-populina 98AG31]
MFILRLIILLTQLLLRSTSAEAAAAAPASPADKSGNQTTIPQVPVGGAASGNRTTRDPAPAGGAAGGKGATRVTLDYGDFNGKAQGGVDIWSSIPYAEPPLGARRFASPVAPTKKYPNFDATKISPGCASSDPLAGADPSSFNQTILAVLQSLPKGTQSATDTRPGQEDCLTLDVTRPSGLGGNEKLPVIFWISESASGAVNPAGLMARGKMIQKPFIWVSANWRSSVFGFLGGKEIAAADAGNLGLKDQRLALEWVQKHISKFGGDPKRVTLYGSNLGGMAVSHQLVAFNGDSKGLFQNAILGGAVALPSPKIASGQATYDKFAKAAGCPVGAGSLACLREAKLEKLVAAANTFPGIFSRQRYPLPFHAYVDGKFLTGSIQDLAKAGKVAKVPIILGSTDDSGTVDTLVEAAHIFNETGVTPWLQQLLPGATPKDLATLLKLYPSDPAQGSPFNTGTQNQLNAVSKQIAALFGDIAYQGIRRFFSQSVQASAPVYGFIDRGSKNTKYLGSYAGVNTLSVLKAPAAGRSTDIQTRYLNFVYTNDPNPKGVKVQWPKYGPTAQLMEFSDTETGKIVPDDFRKEGIQYYITDIMGDSAKGKPSAQFAKT